MREWLDARPAEAEPVPDEVVAELVRLVHVVGRAETIDDDAEDDLGEAFRGLALCARKVEMPVDRLLAALAELESHLEETRTPERPPTFVRALRRGFVEIVRIDRALDRRYGRERIDALLAFGDVLSHELGNRLGAARTGLDLVREASDRMDDDRREELLALVARGIDGALETVDDVGAFVAAQEWTDADAVPLPDVVRSVERRVRALARRQDVQMEVADPIPDVPVEGHRLRLVLWNLLVNGVRYADPSRHPGHVWLRADLDGDALEIEIEDDGLGVAPGEQERIFEVRERGGSAGERPDGTGLGLAIVREAVEQLGGRIELESELGRGSTFRIRLPRKG